MKTRKEQRMFILGTEPLSDSRNRWAVRVGFKRGTGMSEYLYVMSRRNAEKAVDMHTQQATLSAHDPRRKPINQGHLTQFLRKHNLGEFQVLKGKLYPCGKETRELAKHVLDGAPAPNNPPQEIRLSDIV